MQETTYDVAKKVIIERWKNLGLLTGLNDDSEVFKKTALLYEDIANIFINEKVENDDGDEPFMTMIFPIARRLVTLNPLLQEYNANSVVEFVRVHLPIGLEFLEKNKENFKEEFDYEAEFCSYIAKQAYKYLVDEQEHRDSFYREMERDMETQD